MIQYRKNNGMLGTIEQGDSCHIEVHDHSFTIVRRIYGYDEYETSVRYEELDDGLPVCYVFLMPSESTSLGRDILSFSGTLPFLKEIEAVNLNKSLCIFFVFIGIS